MNDVLHVLLIIGSTLFMIFFFGACIFIHELGHFLAAKMCGLKILAFSIGFKKAWGKTINGVEYRIGWLPFGGYVDLPQIDATDDEVKDKDGNVLPKVEPWKRMVTAFAGPLFNVIFGFALACVIWIAGLPQESPSMTEFRVKTVEKESPEYKAGLRAGDVIVKRNGKSFNTSWGGFARDIMLHVGETTLTVVRDGKEMDITYRPAINHKFSGREEIPYPFFRPEIPVIVFPAKDSPAEKAGLKSGDRILSVDGKDLTDLGDFYMSVFYSGGRELALTVQDKDQKTTRTVKVTPKPYPNLKPGDSGWKMGIIFKSPVSLEVDKPIADIFPAGKVLKNGDLILKINGKDVKEVKDLRPILEATKEKSLIFTVKRGEKTVVLPPTSAIFVTPHQIGVSMRILSHPTPWKQFTNVLEMTWRSLKSVTAGVKRQLGFDAGYTTLGVKHLSGPVGIGKHLYLSVYKGSLIIGLNLVVLITFNLGLLNLLPIPVLDGGHIVLALLEMIFRRKVPAKVLQPIAIAFVTLLIAFMVFVTFYDVKKMIPVSPEKKPDAAEKTQNAKP